MIRVCQLKRVYCLYCLSYRSHINYVKSFIAATTARRQVQERLTQQIAQTLFEKLEPRGVMVVIEAEHTCMTLRGVKKPGAKTITSSVLGGFRKDARTRAEAMSLIKG